MIWSFLVYLFIALQIAALIGGIVSRTWKLQPPQLIWRGTTQEIAANDVRAFLWDVNDFRFAYPTGQFEPKDAETDVARGVVVMREKNFSGSKGFGVVFRMLASVLFWARSVASESIPVALIGGFIGLYLALLLSIPFLVASLIDVAYRALYRGVITARVAPHPTIANAVTIDLTFQGLSSFGIVGDVLRGMGEAAPPAGTQAYDQTVIDAAGAPTRARATQWAGAAERRSTVIYGSGVATSMVVALLLAAFAGGLGSQGSYGSDDTYYSSTSDSDASSSSSDESGGDAEDGSSSSTSDDDAGSSDGSSSSSDDVPEGTFASSDGFTVVPPSDWIQDTDSKDKGAFYETRWHSPGVPEVHGYVDHTPGYSGDAEEGARGVRDPLVGRDGYEEIDFSASGDGWRWEFVLDGDHKIDLFSTCDAGGYAVLGAAPEADWDSYGGEIEEFVDSFSCDDTGDASDDTASDDGQADDTTDEASAETVTYPAGTISGKMERAIRNHWGARLSGDYSRAYGYYTTPIRNRAGSESNWASQIAQDGLTDVTFRSFDSTETTPARGRMNVSLETESEAEGCKSWEFHYKLANRGGRWLISDSTVDDYTC